MPAAILRVAPMREWTGRTIPFDSPMASSRVVTIATALRRRNPFRRLEDGEKTESWGSLTITPQGAMDRGAKASMSRSLPRSDAPSLQRWQLCTDPFLSVTSPFRNRYRSPQVRIRRGSLDAMMTPWPSTSSMIVSWPVGIAEMSWDNM